MFRTEVVNEDGEKESDLKTIAITYLKGSFTIDLLATIPFDSLTGIFLDEHISA